MNKLRYFILLIRILLICDDHDDDDDDEDDYHDRDNHDDVHDVTTPSSYLSDLFCVHCILHFALHRGIDRLFKFEIFNRILC